MSSENSANLTKSDAKPFTTRPGNSSNSNANAGGNNLVRNTIEGPPLPGYYAGPGGINPDFYYDMRGDKYMYIFNHYEFKCDCLEEREGTNADVTSLERVFQDQLGFIVKVFNNKKYKDLFKEIERIVRGDYTAAKCVCLVFLTHGDKDGTLYAADSKPYKFKTVMEAFYNSKNATLDEKPKLFFVQACRGVKVDKGTQFDGESRPILTPTHADYLIMRSTIEDFVSYRSLNGSWMIQDLCEVTEQYYEAMDLLHLITQVQRKVASKICVTKDKEGNVIEQTKQMPETWFTLRKFVMFYRNGEVPRQTAV